MIKPIEKINILLKEYECLRMEVLDSFKIRNQTLSFAFATIVFIFGGYATCISYKYNSIGNFLLFVLLPSFDVIILLFLLGELEKVQRIANHLLVVENRINLIVEIELLSWEKSLREKPLVQFYSYAFLLLFFCVVSVSPYWFINGVNIYITCWSWIVDFAFLSLATFKYFKYKRISGVKKTSS
jgi:hypothetical protein